MVNGLSKIDVTPREPLAAEVARQLLDYLMSGQVQVGERIPSERQLTELMGVNRPAVREAIKSLGMMGVVEVRPGSGTYFRGSDIDSLYRVFEWGLVLGEKRIMELMEARAHLEELVAGLAAQNRSEADVVLLRERLHTMRDSGERGFADADVAFHLAIADAGGNTVLRDMLRGLRTVMHSWTGRNVAKLAHMKTAYADHVPIFEAIENQDAAAARTAMAAHMSNAARRLLGTVDPETAHKLTAENKGGLTGAGEPLAADPPASA
ncbi:FadR/GntR family transcriptional regulator [Nocardiopsis deserti]|uniref:FadR/GntR family transcriptional regulator n=1 Tax=Nocardiopsis deserti TaxID=2605988 RepID=UPI001CC24D55|nr:FadR/GntR family transcriptional regulator [Nocardiopsis deserti]